MQLRNFTFTFHFHTLDKEMARSGTPGFLPGESQGQGAWWAAVYGVAQSRTRLKRLSSSSSRFLTILDGCWVQAWQNTWGILTSNANEPALCRLPLPWCWNWRNSVLLCCKHHGKPWGAEEPCFAIDIIILNDQLRSHGTLLGHWILK